MLDWLADRIGVVRIRQLLEEARHRLAIIPLIMLFVGVVASQFTLFIDRQLGPDVLPSFLVTTVASARAILSAIAGGLITAVTLLVSMVLVAVQLASGQLSPRILRNWTGDRTLQRAVGIVLATTVYCLLGLREARTIGDNAVTPSLTVIVAVVMAVVSLSLVVGAVDRVTSGLQIGTIAEKLSNDTIRTVQSNERVDEHPTIAPVPGGRDQRTDDLPEIPTDAIAVEAERSGWVQQIDARGLLDGLPDGHDAWIAVVHGGYVMEHAPLAWLAIAGSATSTADQVDDETLAMIRSCFALGSSRTMQQDVGFGIAQLTDIAVRALSPGVYDPQTALDITMHLGDVLRELWSREEPAAVLTGDGRRVYRTVPDIAEYLHAAFDPIRHYGRSDPAVMTTVAETLVILRREVVRHDLPGPVEPIDDWLDELAATIDTDGWTDRERARLDRALDHDNR